MQSYRGITIKIVEAEAVVATGPSYYKPGMLVMALFNDKRYVMFEAEYEYVDDTDGLEDYLVGKMQEKIDWVLGPIRKKKKKKRKR